MVGKSGHWLAWPVQWLWLEFPVHAADGQLLFIGAAMRDIDYFKNVNDLHGHAAGDLVLAKLASA